MSINRKCPPVFDSSTRRRFTSVCFRSIRHQNIPSWPNRDYAFRLRAQQVSRPAANSTQAARPGSTVARQENLDASTALLSQLAASSFPCAAMSQRQKVAQLHLVR